MVAGELAELHLESRLKGVEYQDKVVESRFSGYQELLDALIPFTQRAVRVCLGDRWQFVLLLFQM